MENKVVEEQKKQLLGKLSPRQKDCLEAVDWLYNGARATGRTHLICTVALLGLLNGQSETYVIDHYPSHEGVQSYTKSLLLSLADEIGLRIQIKENRSGFTVSRVPEYIDFIKQEPKDFGKMWKK